MHIQVEYLTAAPELAHASIAFLEKKPFVRALILLSNAIVCFVALALLLLFSVMHTLNLSQWVALLTAGLWLFGRKPLHTWVLSRRMHQATTIGKVLIVSLSQNGITWSGRGLVPGNMAWKDLKYLVRTREGFILPQSFTRFLWLPFHGFSSPEDIAAFNDFIQTQPIVLR